MVVMCVPRNYDLSDLTNPPTAEIHLMTLPNPMPSVWRLVGAATTFALLAVTEPLSAADASVRSFDISADLAEKSLKQFSAQAGVEVAFGAATESAVRTNHVSGNLTPQHAIDRMLADTPLTALHDAEKGAFSIVARPNAPRAAVSSGAMRQITRQPNDDRTIELSPFEVRSERDLGYTSTQSLSGSRLATDLKNTPASISVLNRELLDDIGARTVQEAMSWAANTTADTVDEPASGGNGGIGSPSAASANNSVRTRGGRNVSVTRNFFRWSVDSDLYNTERLDFSRGPNALLFGDAAAAGVLNVTPSRALFGANRTVLSAQGTSYGGSGRASVDVNRAWGNKIAVRLMGLSQDQEHWREFGSNRREGAYLTALWRPWRKTEIQVDGEWGSVDRLLPQVNIREFMGGWNFSTTVNTPNIAPAALAAAGLERMPLSLVLNAARPQDGVFGWNFLARTLGTNASNAAANASAIATTLPFGYGSLPTRLLDGSPILANGVKTFPVVSRYDFATRLGASRVNSDYNAASLFMRQSIGDRLNLEVAGNVQEETRILRNHGGQVNNVRIDVNEILPAGYLINGSTANPNFLKPFVEDQSLATVDYFRAIEARTAAVYRLNLAFTRQTIGVIGSARRLDNSQRRFGLVRTNGTNPNYTNAANIITERTYLDQRGAATFYELNRSYDLSNGVQAAMATSGANATNSNDNEAWLTSLQAFASGSWLRDERIHTVIGIRRDHYEADGYATTIVDPVTAALLRINKTTHTDLVQTSPSAGAVVRLWPWISVYYNASKSFAPPATATDFRINFLRAQNPIRVSNGSDVGVRFNLAGDRIVGSLGYYTLAEKNAAFGSSSTITDSLRLIGSAIGVAGLDFGTGGATTDISDTETKGYEWDFTANLSRSWSLLLSGGVPMGNSTTNAYPALRAFLGANRATWLATNNPAVAPNLAIVDAEIAALALTSRNFPRYRVNFLSRYSFTEGRIKGLVIGGGVQVFGPVKFEQVPFTPMETASYSVASAFARYQKKFWHANWTFQLNVQNLFDQDNFRWTRFQATALAARPANYRIDAPREVTLTLRTSF